MTNLILASKREVKSGRQMWHVYRLNENEKSEEFYFAEVGKALRYMFLLRKRGGGIIPKAVYAKIMAEYKASKPAEPKVEAVEPAPMKGKTRKATRKSAKKESAPEAVQVSEQSTLAKAYAEMKSKHPDSLLLFRMGDFYEAYGDDAKTASDVLGITLTRRNAKDCTEQMAGFPHHALDTYLPKLVRAGQRVAICDEPLKRKID